MIKTADPLGGELRSNYPPATQGRLMVWGLLASYPFGGVIWQVLHYLAGLRRLGIDVWYVEDSDRAVYSATTYLVRKDSLLVKDRDATIHGSTALA